MRILGLDTATEACSAAVWIDDEVIERYELAPQRHAGLILPMIESVLGESGVSLSQLDALAFGRGPGSFTGLRIAAGVVQGIAFAADLPVAAVSTLAAMARGAMLESDSDRVAAAIDARKNEVYWGCYAAVEPGDVILLDCERVCPPAEVVMPEPGAWIGVGSAWTVYRDILQQCAPVREAWGDYYPRAGDIAALGRLMYQRGEAVSAEQALPVYLRDNVAEKPLRA